MMMTVVHKVPVSQAKAQLAELVRRAEDGEDVQLTRHGETVARIQAERKRRKTPEEIRAVIAKVQADVRTKGVEGEDAARSQDFLYDDDGLPG
jgi:prevent-host-death family protein